MTVGNAKQSFTRLLSAIDDLSAKGYFGNQEIVMQTGSNRHFSSRSASVNDFYTRDEFTEKIASADLVICHGGAVIFESLSLGKVPVVMPRRFKYAEHVDDHQKDLVDALAAEGRIVPAYEAIDLPAAIELARKRAKLPPPARPTKMIALVEEAIRELQQKGP